MNCTANCPCWCIGTHTPPVDTCKNGNCIKLGYILEKPENSVGPCSQQGKVSLKCYDFSACCNSENLRVEVINNSAPDKLTVDSINKNELTFTTTNLAQAYDKIVLTVKAECCKLGDYGQITIFIKDLCECINCDSGESCNNCGECVPTTGDLKIDITEPFYSQPEIGLSIS